MVISIILFLLLILSLIILIVGLIKPKWVVRWGKRKNRKAVGTAYGTSSIVLFIGFIVAAVALVPPTTTSGENTKVATSPKKVSAVSNEVSTSVQKSNQTKNVDSAIGAAASSSKSSKSTANNSTKQSKPQPMTKSQLLSIMKWTNEHFNQVYGRFINETVGNPSPYFDQLEGKTARALSAKGDEMSNATPSPVPTVPYNAWWFIQGDVNTTTDFALAAVSDMANVLDGNQSMSQLNQDISEYKQQFKKTMSEINAGKMLD